MKSFQLKKFKSLSLFVALEGSQSLQLCEGSNNKKKVDESLKEIQFISLDKHKGEVL